MQDLFVAVVWQTRNFLDPTLELEIPGLPNYGNKQNLHFGSPGE